MSEFLKLRKDRMRLPEEVAQLEKERSHYRTLINRLLNKVNLVTCPFIHGNQVSRSDMQELCRRQVEIENALQKLPAIDWAPQVIKIARRMAKGFEQGIATVPDSQPAQDLILYLKKMDSYKEAAE